MMLARVNGELSTAHPKLARRLRRTQWDAVDD